MTFDWATLLTLLTAIASSVAAAYSAKSALDSRRDTRGQFALTLARELGNLYPISPTNANADDVRAALNTLDTVALSVELGLADFDVVRALMGDAFLVTYEELEATGVIAEYSLTGWNILSDHQAATRLYDRLRV